MTDPSTITTVEDLPEPLREELVAKRKAGTTLAELKKQNPHVAPDVIRAVLPPLPKPRAAKPAQTPTTGQRKAKPSAKAQPASNGQAKAELKLAQQVVKLRETDGLSWAAIGFKLKLVPADAGKSNAGGAARRYYKIVRGQEASTGPLPK